jgi:hypothetical protein
VKLLDAGVENITLGFLAARIAPTVNPRLIVFVLCPFFLLIFRFDLQLTRRRRWMTRIKRVPHLPDYAIRVDVAQFGMKLVQASIVCPDGIIPTPGVATAADQSLVEGAVCLKLLITFGLELLLARLW